MECFTVPHNPESCEYPENNLKKEKKNYEQTILLYISDLELLGWIELTASQCIQRST